MRNLFNAFIVLLLVGCLLPGKSFGQAQPPEKFFGFAPASDKKLFTYEQLIDYLKALAASSGRVKVLEVGKSPMDKPMYLVFISSEENIKNLDRLKEINRKLALDAALSAEDQNKLIAEGKVFFYATLSMHSTEVTPTQAFPLMAYDLATTADPKKLDWLNNVVYMAMPNTNPDGMNMIVENYKKHLGTKYEGTNLPGVYHKYVGHDNNRDYVTLSQKDTRVVAAVYNKDWFPQVMVDKHQMGSTGPRYFVTPPADPIAQIIDPGLYNWTWIFGSGMVTEMTNQGLKGVSQHYLFDDYWPGSTQTSQWKNVISMLTEGASAKIATPIYIEHNELNVGGKGLAEYEKGINFLDPWPGGWWGIAELAKYEIASTYSIINTCFQKKEELLRYRNELCKKQVNLGLNEAPYYYHFSLKQQDSGELVNLVNLLKEHGIRVYSISKAMILGENILEIGDIIIPLAQPFRAFLVEVLEKQTYPERHYTPNGELMEPYDITSWSLNLQSNIRLKKINTKSEALTSELVEITAEYKLFDGQNSGNQAFAIFSANLNESYRAVFAALQAGLKVERFTAQAIIAGNIVAAGSFIIPADAKLNPVLKLMTVSPIFIAEKPAAGLKPVKLPRIALVESYFADMDAGWTRFVFDEYKIPFQVIHPQEFEKTDFVKQFDVVVFPDEDKSVLMDGKSKNREGKFVIPNLPAEYAKGMGKKGFENLLKFYDQGGVLVSWGESTKLFYEVNSITNAKGETEEFMLPARDISESVKKAGLSCPGSLIKTNFSAENPVCYGMPSEAGVFYRSDFLMATSIPNFDMDRRVLGNFSANEQVMSGYCAKPELLADKPNLVWIKKNKGQLVLMAFNPQFRASTQATYKLIFNSLLLDKLEN